MTDWYLLLAPLLMLAVIALVRFVGCNWVFGLEPTVPIVDPPFSLRANPGNQLVELTWQHPAGKAKSFKVFYRRDQGAFNDNDWLTAQPGTGLDHALVVSTLKDGSSLVNGTVYCFEVVAVDDNGTESEPSSEECAQPGVINFVVNKTLNNLRNDYTGTVGMTIHVAGQPVMVTALGRIVAPGNSQPVTVAIISAGDNATLGSVAVGPNAPQNEFAYETLPAVRLNPLSVYYVVMQVQSGGDQWYDYPNTTVETTAAASVTAAVLLAPLPDNLPNSAGHSYGPLDFRYYLTVM